MTKTEMKTANELINRYNAVHGETVTLYAMHVDCNTGIIEVYYNQCYQGCRMPGILRFASFENFRNFVEYHI